MLSASQSGQVARQAKCQASTARCPVARTQRRANAVVVRAGADDDAELEKRLEKLRQVKGATPYGQGKSAAAKAKEGGAPSPKAAPAGKVVYDFSDETVHWEGAPAQGDLYLNLALATTLVWLPLTAAAVGRTQFVKYRFTNKRFSVQTTAPWKQEQTDVAYQEVVDVVTVGRAFGLWGDMVISLRNGDKVELRSLEKFMELKQYVLERRDALAGPPGAGPPPGSVASKPKGSMVTAAELMGEPEPAPTGKGKGKGFA